LIDEVNADPRRGYGHEKILTQITVNDLTLSLISAKGYSTNSILPNGEVLILKDTANLSTGGTAEDVTDFVHPANIAMAERISRIIDLDICGIDIMTTDISKPLKETGGAVLEVNAGPGFRMHLAPAKGLPCCGHRHQWKNDHYPSYCTHHETGRLSRRLYHYRWGLHPKQTPHGRRLYRTQQRRICA
jgi:hypothetical protein